MKTMQAGRPLAVTVGDMNGIGPEVALKAAYRLRRSLGRAMVLIGDRARLLREAEILGLAPPPPWNPNTPRGLSRGVRSWDPGDGAPLAWRPGKVEAAAARRALHWVRLASQGCLDGRFAGMVTAPLSKEGLARAGLDWPGHTEYLAQCCGTRRFGMMLIGGGLRVMLVTRHLPLRAVPEALTPSAVGEAIRLAARALPWLRGKPGGRIAVCGLNPHAGDGGVLGSEERRVIAPAIRRARRAGIEASGPHAADAVFFHAASGAFDAVVAMYHDQGLAPLKTLAFESGVNITLGLPIVRTSPDHGTAYDKAGRRMADPRSMVAALRLAAALADRPSPWSRPAREPRS